MPTQTLSILHTHVKLYNISIIAIFGQRRCKLNEAYFELFNAFINNRTRLVKRKLRLA